MTTKQMEYILELAKAQNFNRAAENLFISQPALTYQIKKAEEEIGFEIFIRSGKGAGLTAAGERLVKSLPQILSEYNAAVEEALSLSPGYAAAIRLAIPARLAVIGLEEIIEEFGRENPKAPVLVKQFGEEHFAGGELPEADVVFALRQRKRYRDWREHAVMEGYLGAEDLPRIQDMGVAASRSGRMGEREPKILPGMAAGAQMEDRKRDTVPEIAVGSRYMGEETRNVPQDIGFGFGGRPQHMGVHPSTRRIWIPYIAEPVSVSLLVKKDENREIIHKFSAKFVQTTQK